MSALLTLQACTDGAAHQDPGKPRAMGGTSGASGSGGRASVGSEVVAGSGAEAGSGGSAGDGGTSNEPTFDASALDVVVPDDGDLCRLSDDGRQLIVRLRNSGAEETGPVTLRLRTSGTNYELSKKTPTLAPSGEADMEFERGPVAGFVDQWKFELTMDPDGVHGAPHPALVGTCRDLRSRARRAMIPLEKFYNAGTGLFHENDWWTSANQLETVIDFSRELGDTEYFSLIDNTFEKNKGDNFDKWGYYDDDGWWAMTWIKAYDLTHEQKYLDMAKAIFARMKGGWTSQCGGGIYWASPKAGAVGNSNKNAIPNSLFLQIAAKLHLRTPGDSGPDSYLEWAKREWNWFKNTGMITDKHQVVDGLNNLSDCKAEGPIFTYNQGVLIGGLVDLAQASADESLLDEAVAIAQATIERMATGDGILKEPPCGGDICVQFKGVFMRNLRQLYRVRPLPEFLVYARYQSDKLWNSSVRNDQAQFGWEWDLPFDKATAARQSSALDALIAAVGTSNLNMALFATASGSSPCSATQSAQRAIDGGARGESKWCAGGSSGQVLTVDLGSAQTIVGFRVLHAGAGGENSNWNTSDYEIQVGESESAFKSVVEVTNNTHNSTEHHIPSVTARYARLKINKPQSAPDFVAARIYEFEVLGAGLK